MIPPAPWQLVYADGAANLYGFDGGSDEVLFAYEPMTPERSSSGMYSGGEPRSLTLAAADPRLAAIWAEVARLEADVTTHVESRRKGDGAVTITAGAEPRRFLVERAATRTLEGLLEALR